jgi:hypothetical protein
MNYLITIFLKCQIGSKFNCDSTYICMYILTKVSIANLEQAIELQNFQKQDPLQKITYAP